MLKEIDPRNLPQPTQQLQFELVHLIFDSLAVEK